MLLIYRILQVTQSGCRTVIGTLQSVSITSIRRISQRTGCAGLRICCCRQGVLRLAYLLRQLSDASFHLFGKLCQGCGSLFAHAGGCSLLRGGLHRLDCRSNFIFCRKVRIIGVACLVRCQIQAGRILCCFGIGGLAGSVQSRHLVAQRFPQGVAADLYKFIRFVQFISVHRLNQQAAFGLPAFFIDRANDKNIAEPRGAEQDHTAECQHAGFPAQTMYPAPEGRQVKVQSQQDALYGKRGKICLPRL